MAYCCFIAILRDWARLGLMLANDGAWNGQQIVPRQWLLDATTVPRDSYLRYTIAPVLGLWLSGLATAGRAADVPSVGIHGQALFVDPDSKLVMVQTAVRPKPIDPKSNEGLALWYALVAQYGR